MWLTPLLEAQRDLRERVTPVPDGARGLGCSPSPSSLWRGPSPLGTSPGGNLWGTRDKGFRQRCRSAQ